MTEDAGAMGVEMLSWGARLVCALTSPIIVIAGIAAPAEPIVPSVPDSGLTVAQAHARTLSTLEATQQLVGGVWTDQDDPVARGCVIPSGGEGITHGALRIAPAPLKTTDTVYRVAASWHDLGYTVEFFDIGPVIELQGFTAANELLILRVSDNAVTLQAESECRPE